MPDALTSRGLGSSRRSRTVNAAFLAAVCALLTPNSMLVRAGDPDDSSVFAYVGWLMTRGYTPYRDVWDHKGPVLYYLNWLGWTLTPTSTVGIGILQALVYTGAFFLLIRALQLAEMHVRALLCVALFSVAALAQFSQGGNMAETWALGAIAASHFIAFSGLRARITPWHFALLGASLTACFWIRPNLCVLPGLAILAVGHVQRLRRGFLSAFSGLAVAGATLLLSSLILLFPIFHEGATAAFREAYFGYNSSYSKFTNLHDHLIGAMQLLLVPKTMLLGLLSIFGLLFLLRSRLILPPTYRILLLISFPLEFLAAAMSGRPYFHYLAALWPSAFVLAAVAAYEIRKRFWFGRGRAVAICLLVVAVCWELRRYALFERKAIRLDPHEAAVAAFIDAESAPTDRILPVGDVAATAVALRSLREPAGRFVYQLAMVHRANHFAPDQQAEEMNAVASSRPKLIFSVPSMVGDLCGDAGGYRAEGEREGYDFGRMSQLLTGILDRGYRRVADPRFGYICVYERR